MDSSKSEKESEKEEVHFNRVMLKKTYKAELKVLRFSLRKPLWAGLEISIEKHV